MASVLLLPDAATVELSSIEFDKTTKTLVATALTTSSEARCPACQPGFGEGIFPVYSHAGRSPVLRTTRPLARAGATIPLPQ